MVCGKFEHSFFVFVFALLPNIEVMLQRI